VDVAGLLAWISGGNFTGMIGITYSGASKVWGLLEIPRTLEVCEKKHNKGIVY
jgi:hypothetical protein